MAVLSEVSQLWPNLLPKVTFKHITHFYNQAVETINGNSTDSATGTYTFSESDSSREAWALMYLHLPVKSKHGNMKYVTE